jgi:hypothetical protein
MVLHMLRNLFNLNNLDNINFIRKNVGWIHHCNISCDNCKCNMDTFICYNIPQLYYPVMICFDCYKPIQKIENISRENIVQSLIIIEASVLPLDVLLNHLIPLLV